MQPGDRTALTHHIQTLMDNPTLGKQMGTKSRITAEQKFNAQKNFQTLESLFHEVAITHSSKHFSPALSG